MEFIQLYYCEDFACNNIRCCLIYLRHVDNFSTGRIYSIVAYLWTFIGQTDYLPELMESLGSVKDLNMRFELDDEVNTNHQSVLI